MDIIDPEIYRPLEHEHAFHPQPGIPGSAQWWYNSAILDNGYIVCLEWGIAGEVACWANFLVFEPDGKRTLLHFDYLFPTEVTASTETLNIATRNSSCHGTFPTYELHIDNNDNTSADLVFECITQPVRQPPAGVYVGRLLPPTPKYMTYVVRLRNKVTGKMVLAGKEIPVSSDEGYSDHQWGNCSPMLICHSWYWGCLYLPNYTLVWGDHILSETFGYQTDKWLWLYKGEKPVKYLTNMDFFVEPSDVGIHEGTATPYPRQVTVIISSSGIQGTVTYRLKHILQSVLDMAAWLPGFTIQGPPRYFRYLSDVHYDLVIEGEKIKGDKLEIQELGI